MAAATGHWLARPSSRARALPAFLIAGAQRAGTTSLYRYLCSHPGVIRPRFIKGAHYFDLHYSQGLGWYQAHFPTRRRLDRLSATLGYAAITGEASPYYMFHPAIPTRIAETLPDVKVIVVLRDPVARAWSQYQHEFARGFETLSFEDALAAEEERLAGEAERLLRDDRSVSYSHIHHSYRMRGQYIHQVRRLQAALGTERLLVIEFSELKTDLQATFDRVTEFLRLPRWQLGHSVAYNARSYGRMNPATRRWLARSFSEPNEQLFSDLGIRWNWASA